MRIVPVLLAAIGIAASPAAAADLCRDKGRELGDYLANAQRLGIIRAADRVQVDEAKWDELAHAQKVTLALAAFCHDAGAGGRATTILYGWHDGRIKARVVDGNYSEG